VWRKGGPTWERSWHHSFSHTHTHTHAHTLFLILYISLSTHTQTLRYTRTYTHARIHTHEISDFVSCSNFILESIIWICQDYLSSKNNCNNLYYLPNRKQDKAKQRKLLFKLFSFVKMHLWDKSEMKKVIFCCQFHQYFTSSFCPNILLTKNYKA